LEPIRDVGLHCPNGSVCVAPQNIPTNRLSFVFDREYKLSGASGETLTFDHYQLQPTMVYEQDTFWKDLCALFDGYVVHSGCATASLTGSEIKIRTSATSSSRDVPSTSEHSTSSSSSSASATTLPSSNPARDSTFFRLENRIPCVGRRCAVQHCLYRCWFDETQTPSDRFDAMVLFFWDDLYEEPFDELSLDENNQWAVNFMIKCLKSYPPAFDDPSGSPNPQIFWEQALFELRQGQ